MKRLLCLVLCAVLLSGVRISAMAVSAKAAAVINGDTGEILFSQNADEKLHYENYDRFASLRARRAGKRNYRNCRYVKGRGFLYGVACRRQGDLS